MFSYLSENNLLPKQFFGTPVKAKVTAACTLAAAFQKVRIKPDAVQEVAELCKVCIHDFALTIEIRIRMNLDVYVRVVDLQEPFKLNGVRQILVLLGDTTDEEGFCLIGRLNFYLRK